MKDEFVDALDALAAVDDDAELSAPILAALPVKGASVSTLGRLLGNETVSASDAIAARIDELQFDLGEGPCWDALSTGRAGVASDVAGTGASRWPSLEKGLSRDPVGAIFAYPLLIGTLRLGAIDLYNEAPSAPGPEQHELSWAVAAIVGRYVLRRALRRSGVPNVGDGDTVYSRRVVHQATGFVIAQLGVSAEDAELLIRGHAFAEGRSMSAVADEIVSREFAFEVGAGSEDTR